MSEIIEDFRRIVNVLNGVATHFNGRLFSLASQATIVVWVIPAKVYLWIWTSQHTACTHAMPVLFHHRLLWKFNVLFARFDSKTGLWKIPPVKTKVAHRTAQSSDGRVPSLSVWPNPRLERSPIGHYRRHSDAVRLTRSGSRKKLARALSPPGVGATAILATKITWWHGNADYVCSRFKL